MSASTYVGLDFSSIKSSVYNRFVSLKKFSSSILHSKSIDTHTTPTLAQFKKYKSAHKDKTEVQKKNSYWSIFYLREVLGFAFYALMAVAHKLALFGPHGGLGWIVCAVICTGAIAYIGWPVFKNYRFETLRLGSLMSIVYIGVVLSIAGFYPWLAYVLVGSGVLGLIRSLLGHMNESNKDWLKGIAKVVASQLVLFSLLQLMVLSLPAQMLVWVIISTGMIYLDWPIKNYEGAGMVATSFISCYLSWLVSSSAILFPVFMHALGVHVFYHDALLTMVAISFGFNLKKKARNAALKDVKKPFPELLVKRKGEGIIRSPQSKLKVGDWVCLEKGDTLLPGISINVEEASCCARAQDQSGEEDVCQIKIGDKFGLDQTYDRLSQGSLLAKVEVLDQKVGCLIDPGASYMRYFVPSLLIFSLTSGLFWLWVGNPMQAISVIINMLLVACPCVFTIALPVLEYRATAAYNKADEKKSGDIEILSLESIKSDKADILVVDRSHTLVTGCDENSGVWIMTSQSKGAFKSLIQSIKPKMVLVLSGHSDRQAKSTMENDLKSLVDGVDLKIWMSKSFNSVNNASASENKGKVIEYLQSFGGLPGTCQNCWEKNILNAGVFKRGNLSSVMMVGDGNNDTRALGLANIGIAVGDNSAVLALSGAGIRVRKFDFFNGSDKDKGLGSLLKVVGEHLKVSYYFKCVALMFNVFVVFMAAGGYLYLFGVSMPPSLSCMSMAMFSFALASVAKGWDFMTLLKVKNEIVTESSANSLVSDVRRSFARLVRGAVTMVKDMGNAGSDNQKGCCG
jgi:cation transport ATPase